MTYAKTTWTDRIVQNPLTFTQQTNADGTITLIPAEGTVTQAGTPITADALNNMENGIADALPMTGGGTVVGDVDIQGELMSEGEAHFAYAVGYYSDPRPNVRQALKVTGGIATDNLYIGDAKFFIGHDTNGGILFAPDAGNGRYTLYCDQNQYFNFDDGYGASILSSGWVRLVFHQTAGDSTFRIESVTGGPANLIVATINGSSDRKMKKNIKEVTAPALNLIKETKIYNYHFDEEDETEVPARTGVLADEAPKEIVGDNQKSINLYNMISLAWKAIQELSDEISALKNPNKPDKPNTGGGGKPV
jgi:Chaperone of endosialidase